MISPVPDGVQRPFWSVMIPTYNAGERLRRTLESVLVQDPGPDEMQIRIVDDGSYVDDPGAVARAVAGDRIQVWRQPRNVGAPVNFTTCAQQATGHWVHILHSDDLVLPGFYAAYRRRIEQGSWAMVAARAHTVDDDEQIEATSPKLTSVDGGLVDAFSTIAEVHPFHFASVVVARSTYEQIGGFDPELVHANDWEMWTRAAMHGPVGIIDEPLSLYRQHADSDTNRLRKSAGYLDDTLLAVEIIAERFDDPRRGRAFRDAARHRIGQSALAVAEQARASGHRRSALAHAARGARLDPSADTWRRAREIITGR